MGLFGFSSDRTNNQPAQPAGPGDGVVLVVSADAGRRAWMDRSLKQDDLQCELASSPADALGLLARGARGKRDSAPSYAAALVDTVACTPATLKLLAELTSRDIAPVVLCPDMSFDEAVAAMRAGAADIVSTTIAARDLTKRVRAAAKGRLAPAPERARATPIGKDKREGAVAGAPAPAHPTSADLRALLSQELDVEALLRHTLEHVLARLGPTNAAVFLPGSTGEYQLGAYVNFSCPKETAEVMLDHLANVAAPRLDRTVGVIELRGDEQISEALGDSVEWLGAQRVLAFACRQEGETLAVFMIFRETGVPFPAGTATTLADVRDVFGAQLGKVIRIHHRHLPRDRWGAIGDGLDAADDDNMAA
jgi:DNA-binding response OmpR family regulator